MAVPRGYHFTLDIGGVTYPFILPEDVAYGMSDLSPFTQRSAAGGLSLTDLDHQGAFEQRSFHHGMGQVEMVEDNRYRYSEFVDARHPGAVSLWSKINEIQVDDLNNLVSMTSDGTYLYLAGTGNAGVYAWDGTTLTNIKGTMPSHVKELFYNGQYVFAGLWETFDSTDPVNETIYRFNGNVAAPVWTPCALDSASDPRVHKAQCFVVHDGYHWHAQYGSNLIHYWRQDNGEDAETDILAAVSLGHPKDSAEGDPGAVQVGPNGRYVKRMISYNGFLYAFRTDGMWEVRLEGESYVAYRLTPFQVYERDDNFDAVVIKDGAIFFNCNGRIYRYTGTTVTDFSIPGYTEEWPPLKHGAAISLMEQNNFLYAVTNNNLYVMGEVGWHHIRELETEGTVTSVAQLNFKRENEPNLHCVLVTFSGVAEAHLYYWEADDEYSRAPYELEGTLYASMFDSGFMNVPKHWVELKVLCHIPRTSINVGSRIVVTALSHNGTDTVQYNLGTITHLETTATTVLASGDSVYNRSIVNLRFPYTAEGRQLQLRFDLYSDTEDATPVLYGYLLEYVLRPPTIWGFNPSLKLSDNQPTIDLGRDPYTAAQKVQFLEAARDSVTPLYFEDFLGNLGYVYVSAIRETVLHVNPGNAERAEIQMGLSLVMLHRFSDDCETVNLADATTVEGPYNVPCTLELENILTVT